MKGSKRPALDRYLCAILLLKQRYFCVRAIDVARYLDCSKASVSISLRQLAEEELIYVEEGGNVILSQAGEDRAKMQQERHTFFFRFLTEAGVDQLTAEQEALAISHAVSDRSFMLLKKYAEAEK